jgi:hypothetical protein
MTGVSRSAERGVRDAPPLRHDVAGERRRQREVHQAVVTGVDVGEFAGRRHEERVPSGPATGVATTNLRPMTGSIGPGGLRAF